MSADFAALRLPATLGVLPVLRSAAAAPEPLPPRILFEGPTSGSGALSDWGAAAELARRAQLMLAGGLHADNVAAALAACGRSAWMCRAASNRAGRQGSRNDRAIRRGSAPRRCAQLE